MHDSGAAITDMAFFSNLDVNHLTIHSTLHKLAWGGYGVFSGVILLRAGVSLRDVFLVFAAIYLLRLLFRPMVPRTVAAIGMRNTLIFGTLLFALQFPALGIVQGIGPALLFFCILTAVATVFYWTCYHALFAALGDAAHRGSQVGARQALGTAAAVAGPALGGIMLVRFGPLMAFGVAALIELCAIIPLLRITRFEKAVAFSQDGLGAARTGLILFATDGWIIASSVLAWNIIMFRALDTRFDSLGWVLATAALAGAIGGMLLGRFIDLGHTRRAIWLNATILCATLIIKSICGESPLVVVVVTIGSTLLGGLYVPALMTAFYNEAKASPSPLQFQYVSEGGWDIGGGLVCILAAVCVAAGAPLQLAIALALPAVFIQAYVLNESYSRHRIVADGID
jgi:MFS family permease